MFLASNIRLFISTQSRNNTDAVYVLCFLSIRVQ